MQLEDKRFQKKILFVVPQILSGHVGTTLSFRARIAILVTADCEAGAGHTTHNKEGRGNTEQSLLIVARVEDAEEEGGREKLQTVAEAAGLPLCVCGAKG